MRARAAEIVHQVARGGTSLDVLLAQRSGQLDERDRALLKELCFGALRWYWRGLGVVQRLVKRPLKARDRVVEALLVVGVYQLDQMRLPAHAALHATVDACAVLGRPGFKGLVNGVLRSFQRRRSALLAELPGHARDAHPEWLWRAIHSQWPDQADAVIEAGNSRPPMTLRVNTRQLSVDAYLAALEADGLRGRRLDHAPAGVVLDGPVAVERLPGFASGWVSVQDASAQMLTRVVQPGPGARVLDACAAPGGKLTHMLEAFPEVVVQGVDSDPARLELIRENLQRLGLDAEIAVADAADPSGWWDGTPFDLVLLDAPCSGTGVIRRHPDIKVLRRASDLAGFAAAQARLLDGLWPVVKPGGCLLYVTCSIMSEENQEQFASFLRRAPDCRDEPVELPLGAVPGLGRQLLPGDGGGDGFFYAVARKTPGPKG